MHTKSLFGLVFVLMVAAACAGRTAAPTRAPGLDLDPGQPAAIRQDGDPGTTSGIPSPAPGEPDYCLECHSDKQRLIDTAGPEVEHGEGESSGVG